MSLTSMKRVFSVVILLCVLPAVWACAGVKSEGPLEPSVLPSATWTVAFTSTSTLPPCPTCPALPTFSPEPTGTYTPTFSPTPMVVHFAVIGDYGEGKEEEADVAALVHSWNPDFIITTGDNNYPSGAAETIDGHIGRFYHDYIYPYKGIYGEGATYNRFFPSLGNHDWDTNGAQAYFDYFTLPGNERYYDFAWGPVHLFALDSDSREPDGVSATSIQAMWLKERLATSTSPWKIVYMHHPPYSSGVHGSVDWMQWPFKDWGVTALLAGHDHVYERLLIDGFPLFINGLGGGSRYAFKFISPYSVVRFNADYGAMLVIANEHQITFQFITRYGEVIDNYQIIR